MAPVFKLTLAALLAAFALAGSAAAAPEAGCPATATVRAQDDRLVGSRVLVFSKTVGYRHASIPAGVQALRELGAREGFDVEASEDAALFTLERLRRYDAVIFLNTSGDVLNAEQEAAFQAWARDGGGLVGVHAAADTEQQGDWTWYRQLLGGVFKNHPNKPNVREALLLRTDAHQPAATAFAEATRLPEEWYNFRELQPASQVLLTLDESSYEGGDNGACHPIAWMRELDGGRAFYTGLGHESATFARPDFRHHLLEGLRWAVGPGRTERRLAPKQTPTNTPASMSSARVHDIATLNVHDPSMLVDPKTRRYYIYGGYAPAKPYDVLHSPEGRAGVKAYWSEDLKNWHGPILVHEAAADAWHDKMDAPWAPEVSEHDGKYYLVLTYNDWGAIMERRDGRPPITRRAVQILVGDEPLGPFRRTSNAPITPPGVMALDGTLYWENGLPWLVYAHEWIQRGVGSVDAIPLSADLTKVVGDPVTLIEAGDVDWARRDITYKGVRYAGVVTDGPSLYKAKNGSLMLLWSSWSRNRDYTTSLAVSKNGKLAGPWTHRPAPLLTDDRGHGTLFTTFEGDLRLVLHRYFHQPLTRTQIYGVIERGDDLYIDRQLFGQP